MVIAMDRSEILRGLQILYPPKHGIIELDILKTSGQLWCGHFDNIDLLLDEIEKYDGHEDTLAIYTGLNRIKPKSFKPTNNVAAGRTRSKSEDIERITGILFDLDPYRSNGDPKDSTTYEEHQAGLDAADWLKHRLSLIGWPEPAVGDSGNGGQLRYLTDLPATEESSSLIKRVLEAANSILPDQLKDKVEVDTATHDRPRISKVFGTMTRKGPGTEERPWRRSWIISVPREFKPVQLDSILKLIDAAKMDTGQDEDPEPIRLGDRTKALSEIENDQKIKPCLKEIILKKDLKRLEEFSAHEHKGRVAIATEMIVAGYSDAALHKLFSRLADYDKQKTSYQLDHALAFVRKGCKTWLCSTLRDDDVISAKKCQGCEWIGHGQDPLIILKAQVKADPGAIYDDKTFQRLRSIYNNDPSEWERVKKILRASKASVRDLVNKFKDEDEEDEFVEKPFIALEDGKLAEMVVQNSIAKFAVYDPATQNIVYVPELQMGGVRILPPAGDEIFLKGYVSLPSEAEEYGAELTLYNEIRAFIHKYLEVSDEYLEVSDDYEVIACFYPMLSWVYDAMSVIVYLRARGDWGTGKSRFLAVLCSICYRAVSATGAISDAPIFRIMDKWFGTMGLDEADFNSKTDASATIAKILNCGYEKGKPVIRCDANDPNKINVFDPFGPKIIATRYEF